MQRTFITELPKKLEPNQVVVDLPRYEVPLARALLRRDAAKAEKFLSDEETLNIPPTTVNQIKTFVDELALLDTEIDGSVRVPYTNYVGLLFKTSKDAVDWARKFVQRFFPATEERLLKRQLLTLPLDKTEIVWVGGDSYLAFVKAVAMSPSTDDLVRANTPSAASSSQLTIEQAKAKRSEIAARQAERRGKKDEAPAVSKIDEASTDEAQA